MTVQVPTKYARRSRGGTVVATLVVAVLGGCTSPSPAPLTAPATTAAATPEQAALEAYGRFWRVVDAAGAAPRAENWEPQIQAVGSGQALQTAMLDVRNYAGLPAHTVGTITRTPAVVDTAPQRVSILDCVDLGATQLISDRDGSRLDDAAHRVQRFRLHADVVATPDGRWLVDSTAPNLAEPC